MDTNQITQTTKSQNFSKSTDLGEKTCPFHAGKEFQPFTNPQLENPYPFFERARNEEPIFYSEMFNAYVVTRYDDVIGVLKDPVRFCSKDSLQSIGNYVPEVFEELRKGFPLVSLINSDGEQHKRLRAPFMKMFATDKLVKMETSILAIANRLVDGFVNDGSADILSQFAYPLPLEVIFTMYGVPLDQMAQIKHWGNEVTALFSSVLTPQRQIECARGFVALQNYIAGLIEERRAVPGDDFISEIHKSDLNLGESVLLLCEMVLAGHKTAANLIGKSLKLLLERPQAWQALCNDKSLIPAALEEVLRYDTPAQSMIRTTTTEVELGGVTLPKDTRILLLYGSANRDENRFSDSDNFDIKRFQNKTANHINHIAFSHGMHHCLGANLARREGRIALEVLSSRLPNLKLIPDQQPTHIPSVLNRGYQSLKLEWDVTAPTKESR